MLLQEVLETLLDGPAIAYWAKLAGAPLYRAIYPRELEAFAITAEDKEGKTREFRVTRRTIAAGLRRLQNDSAFKVDSAILGGILVAAARDDIGPTDALGCDVILQAALFGEILYG